MFKKKKVLILAPHTDDGELGCGGTVAKLIEDGNEVFYIAFSICEESVPDGYPKDILAEECKLATKQLGIPKTNLILHKFPVRKLNFHRQEILEILVQLRKKIRPDIIFMPSSVSLHQDHITIYHEGVRAFKHYTCFGYELPWDTTGFPTGTFFTLGKKHIQKKWNAIKKYETQNFRSYCDKEFLFGLARVRGAQIAQRYAEAFESIRTVY